MLVGIFLFRYQDAFARPAVLVSPAPTMSSKPRTILADATIGFRNGLRRMTSNIQTDRPLAKGKENYPSQARNLSTPDASIDPHRWEPVDGKIIIKVSVPSTDDIWRFKVPENISFRAFRAKVELKVGFAAVFTDGDPAGRRVVSEEGFRRWVAGRVKNGRNQPLTVHKKHHPFIAVPSTPTSPLSPMFPSTPATPITPTIAPHLPTPHSRWTP